MGEPEPAGTSDAQGPLAAFMAELAQSRWDLPTFAGLLGLEMHPGQIEFFDALLMRDNGGVRPAHLNVALAAGNRAGKTLALAVVLLHHSVHKIGAPVHDGTQDGFKRWAKYPWHAYHFGHQQEIADLAWHEVTMLLDGVHPAQNGRGCPMVDFLGRDIAETGKKDRGEYKWIKWNHQLGGGEVHCRTTSERAVGQLGKNMDFISYDECGFDPHLSWVVNEVLNMRRLSTSGQLVLISTPSESFSQFGEEWEKGNPENPDRKPYHLSVRMSTRQNVGYGVPEVEFKRMLTTMPKHLIAQNVDGHFIEGRNAFFNAAAVDLAFDPGLHPCGSRRKHVYVQGVDPALSYDATWSITLDHTRLGHVVGVQANRREGKQSVPKLVSLIRKVHEEYNSEGGRCLTACDTSGMGGKVFQDELSGLHPFRAVEFGGVRTRKLKMLTDLKGYIEKGWLRFPKSGVWLELRKQLLAYRLDDKNLKTDAVMALAVAIRQLVRHASQAGWASSMPFDAYDETPVKETRDVRPEHRWDSGDERAQGRLGRRLRLGADVAVGRP